MMKKILALLITGLMSLACLTGCMSPLASSIETHEKKYACSELDLALCFSEEEGFHHPTIEWGMNRTEINDLTGWDFSTLMGYSEEKDVIYASEGPYTMINGLQSDQMSLTVTADEEPFIISYIFIADDDAEGTPLKDTFESYLTVLTEKFGEPEETESSSTVNSTGTKTLTEDWTYTASDGTTTHLQFCAARVTGSDEYSYVSLGFVKDLERE